MNEFTELRKIVNNLIARVSSITGIKNDNLLRFAIAEILVYIDFLEIIFLRYKELIKLSHENHQKQQNLVQGKSGSWTMTPEQINLFEEGRKLYSHIRLEIEAFYLFAHVLLTKATNFPKRYFSHTYIREIKCGSHKKFWKGVCKSQYFKPIPGTLNADINWFNEKVVQYRDKIITHTLKAEHDERMLIKGFSWGPDGSFKMSSSVLYPTEENSKQVDSEKLEDIVIKLQSYFESYISFLLKHIDKSILPHKSNADDLKL